MEPTNNQIRLFDQITPTHIGPADHIESTFSFLKRSARPASDRVRSALEEWFARYPDDYKLDLSRRFRADFPVGFFELLLHELLLRCDHKVEVHPQISPAQGNRPDFRASDRSGNVLILEGAIVTDESKEEKARNRMLATLYDQINQLHIPDYFLRIIAIRNPSAKQPSGTRFKQFITECLHSVKYNGLLTLSNLGAFNLLPTWTFRQGLLEIDFGLIPVSAKNRGKLNHGFIGLYPTQTQWCNTHDAIRAAIVKKAGKFGRLNSPYIIALNCLSKWGTDKIDETQALFGTEQFLFTDPRKRPGFLRKPEGVWVGPRGPRNTRVSAVLITTVLPWNLPRASVRLYHNPWAAYPYKGPLTSLPQMIPKEDQLISVPGSSLGSIFSFSDTWPGQLFNS